MPNICTSTNSVKCLQTKIYNALLTASKITLAYSHIRIQSHTFRRCLLLIIRLLKHFQSNDNYN